MTDDDVRMYLFDIPGQAFGDQAYGEDPSSAMREYYEGGMCDGDVQADEPWTVTMVEVPAEAHDEVRERLEGAACEEYEAAIDDLLQRYPDAEEYRVEITPHADGSYRYREV